MTRTHTYRWLPGLALLGLVGLLLGACSGPSSNGGGSSGGPLPDDVIVSSQPITTGSDIVVIDEDADEGSVRVVDPSGNADGVEAMGPALLAAVTKASLGSFLADANGRTVYLFTNDRPFDSTCDAVCQQNWPPVLTTGMPEAGDGVDRGLLGTMIRADGDEQVTYNGWPLYYSADDTEPGTTYGQAVNDLWFVVSPTGAGVVLE